MKLRHEDVLLGRQIVGSGGFRAGLSGKNIFLEIDRAPVRFGLLISHRQWRSFIQVLRGAYRLNGCDGLSGYSFSRNCPMYHKEVKKSVPVEICGRMTRTTVTSRDTVKSVRKTGWTDEIALDYRGISCRVGASYFLRMREACLKLDDVLKARPQTLAAKV